MRTDLQLHKDVLDELRWDPQVNDAEIGVAAKGGVVTLTPDPKKYPDVKPIALDLTQPEKNRLEFDLGCMTEPKNALGKNGKVVLRPATAQELEKWFSGKRPE